MKPPTKKPARRRPDGCPFTPAQMRRMGALYQRGASSPTLAAKFGVSFPTILTWLARYGYKIRPKGRQRALSSTMAAKVVQARRKHTAVGLANMLGVTPQTIANYVRRAQGQSRGA